MHATGTMQRTGWWCVAVALATGPVRAQDLLLDEGPAVSRAVDKVAVAPDVRPHSATVLTGEELWRRGFRTLGDALAFVVGIRVETTTTGRVYTQRGIPSGLSLVIDGIPQVLASERAALDVDDMSLVDVERVEIVRGPATATHGVGPLSGVVSVITRKPGLQGGGVRVGVTHLGERDVGADASFRAGNLAARATLSYRGGTSSEWRLERVPTRYISLGEATLYSTQVNRTVPVDGDQQLGGRVSTAWRGFQVDAWFTRSERFSPLSRFSHALVADSPQSRLRQQQGLRAWWKGFAGPAGLFVASYATFQKRQDRIPLYPRAGPFPAGGDTVIAAETATAGALGRLEVPLTADHRLVLGAFSDVTKTDAQSDTTDPVTGSYRASLVSQHALTGTVNLAGEYQWDVGRGVQLTAGLVGEWRTSWGFSLAPRASLAWNPRPFFTARLAYSEGTRSPDRYDFTALTQAVVAQRVTGTQPNAYLRPERVRAVETGVSFDPGAQLHVGADVYLSRHEDGVTNVVEGISFVPRNQRARLVTGLELMSTADVVPGLVQAWGGVAVSRVVDGPPMMGDLATVLFGAEVTPLPGLEAGTRSALRHREGKDAAAGLSHTTDVFLSYRTGGVTFMGVLRNTFNQHARSFEEPGLPHAPDVAVPGPGRTAYVAVEGRL